MPLDEDFYKSSYERIFGDFMGDVASRMNGSDPATGVAQDYRDPYSQVSQEAQQLFPEAEGLSPEEEEELQGYKSRLRDLKTMESPQGLGSYRIRGNPYSIDTRGAMQGVGNLATSLVNREREDRIYGDEGKASRASRGAQVVGKLGDLLGSDSMQKVREKSRDRRAERYSGFGNRAQELKGKEAQAAQQAQNRQEYIEEQVPERVESANDRQHDITKINTEAEVEAENQRAEDYRDANRLNTKIDYWKDRDEKDRQNAIQEIKTRENIEGSGNDVSATILEGMADIPKNTVKSINNQIEKLSAISKGTGERAKSASNDMERLNGYKSAMDDIAIDIYNQGRITPEIKERISSVNQARLQGVPLGQFSNNGGSSGGESLSDYGITEDQVGRYAELNDISQEVARDELINASKGGQ